MADDDRTYLEQELRRAQRNLEVARYYGDAPAIDKWENESIGIEADLANLARTGPALQESVPVPDAVPTLRMVGETEPPPPEASIGVPRGTMDPAFDVSRGTLGEPMDRNEARGALGALDEAEDPSASDYLKSAYSDLVRTGGSALLSMERDAREEQYKYLDVIRSAEPDPGTPDHDRWQEAFNKAQREVEAGEELRPTFYGTFIRPFTQKGDKSPGQRLMDHRDQVLKSRTKAAQTAAEKPFFPEPEIFAKNFNAADPSTWFDGTAMPWEDWDAFSLNMAQNVASIGASLGSAVVGGRGGAMFKARQLRAEGVLNPQIVRQKAAEFGAKTGTVSGMGTEYVLVRDAVSQQTEEALKKPDLWDNEEIWKRNADYNLLVEKGYTSELAKQMLVDEAAGTAGVVAGVASMALGAPLNKYLARIGLAESASRLGSAARVGAGEALTEGLQETTEQLTQNVYERKFDPSVPLTRDLLNSFFGGVAMGGGYGAITGALAGGDSQAAFNADQKKLMKAGFGEWRKTANERSALQTKIRDPEYMTSTPAEQRVKDFLSLEDLQYREAKAFLRAEPTIRKMQAKHGSKTNELIRTDKLGNRARAMVASIERARADRSDADKVARTEAQRVAERDALVRQIEEDTGRLDELKLTKADLQTIQEGGRLEDEARYDRLVEQGYGRWTSNARTRFVLTQAGKAAAESIDLAVAQTEQKLATGYTGPERRKDLSRRKSIASMTEEQIEQELYYSKKAGIQNDRAYREDEAEAPAKAYASVDADSLKWVNDNFGHSKGDELLKKIGGALNKMPGVKAYHVSGDEFVVRGESQEQVEAALKEAVNTLQAERISGVDGRTIQPSITWGTGTTFDEADMSMTEWKRRREKAGKRSPRDVAPPTLQEADEILTEERQQRAPMKNEAPERSLTRLWIDLMNKGDPFSLRRAQAIADRVAENRTEAQRQELNRYLNDLSRKKTDKDLKREFIALAPESKQIFERKAREFYQPYVGSYVTALQAYLIEHGSSSTQEKMLPSLERNTAGEPVDDVYKTASAKHASTLLKSGAVPPQVLRSLKKQQSELAESGIKSSMDELLHDRINDYFAAFPLPASFNTSPLSENTEDYDEIVRRFKEDLGPPLMMMADENYAPGFYFEMKRGDQVEVIANGNVVPAVVMSADDTSIMVDLGAEKVYDHDSQEETSVARFSTRWGWQISARMARGGTGYHKQFMAWPGQARLGRRLVNDIWETAKQNERKKLASINERKKQALPGLRSGMATRNEMRRAVRVANNLLADFKNLPPIHIANTVADMPVRMQKRLLDHGSNGMGVIGMFDEVDPSNGVWIIVGNAVDNIKFGRVPYYGDTMEEIVAQGVLHEVIGHYGLRGFMGSDKRLDAWMDALARSFPAQVGRKALGYGFARTVQGGNIVYVNDAARRLAAEEWFAETVQKLLVKQFVAPKEEILVRRIISYVKQWLIDRGYGRFVKLSTDDVMRLIYSAQNFAQAGNGWRFETRTGVVKTTYMRDAEMFRSALEKTFMEATRPMTKDERNNARQKGLDPQAEVLVFPAEATTQYYKQLFEKAVKDGKFTAREYEFTGVGEFLDNVTYKDLALRLPDPNPKAIADLMPRALGAEYLQAHKTANYNADEKQQRVEAIEKAIKEAEDLEVIGDMERALQDPNLENREAVASLFLPSNEPKQLSLMSLEDLRKLLEEEKAMAPGIEEINAARVRLGEIIKSRVDKKIKIPKVVVADHIRSSAVKIRPVLQPTPRTEQGQKFIEGYRVPADWTDADIAEATQRGIDVNPNNWNDIRPRAGSSSYSEHTPLGTDRTSYLVYVLRQEMPTPPSDLSLRHSFGNNAPGDFMHIRIATGEDASGDPVYELIEMQSDPFQGMEGHPQSESERLHIKAIEMQSRRRLASASGSFRDSLLKYVGEHLNTLIYDQGTRLLSGESGERDTASILATIASEPLARVARRLEQEANSLRDSIEELGYISEDDARYEEYKDLQAMLEVVSNLYAGFNGAMNYISGSLSSLLLPDPANVMETRFPGFWGRNGGAKITSIPDYMLYRMSHFAALGKYSYDPIMNAWQRVFATPRLSKNLSGLMKRAADSAEPSQTAGQFEYDSEMKSAIEAGRVHVVDVDASAIPAEYRDDVFTDQGIGRGLRITDNGWQSDSVTVESLGNGRYRIAILPRTDRSQTADAAESVKAAIRFHVNSALSEDWRRNEADRRRKLLGDIRRLESGTVADWDLALQEISYQSARPVDLGYDSVPLDSVIDRKIAARVDDWRQYDFADEVERRMDGYLEDENGVRLDSEHEEYKDRLEFDEDGDVVDSSDADEWLSDARMEAAEREVEEGGEVYRKLYREFEREFNDSYGDPDAYAFEIPVEWDENGDVTMVVDGHWATNYYDENMDDADYWPVESSMMLKIEEWDVYESFDDVDDLKQAIFRAAIEHYRRNNITPPAGSQFRDAVAPNHVLARLREEAQEREEPNWDNVANGIEQMSSAAKQEALEPRKTWETAVRAHRLTEVMAPPSPVIGVWKQIGAKFLIADAVRKGFKKIQWQPAEAGVKRGGWYAESEWTKHSVVSWQKVNVNIGDKTEMVYKIITPESSVATASRPLLVHPTRMSATLGTAAYRMIQDQERRIAAGERVPDATEDRFTVAHVKRSTYVVFDTFEDQIVGSAQSEQEADRIREERVAQVRRQQSNEVISSGRITSLDLGGTINVAKSAGMGSGSGRYVDDPELTTGHIRGARVNYETILVSTLNKLAEKFGGRVTEGRKAVATNVASAAATSGLRVEQSNTFDATHPNSSVKEVIPGRYMLVDDRGLVDTRVFDNYDNASDALERIKYDFNNSRTPQNFIKVFELNITPQMEEYFGPGEIPIMMAVGAPKRGVERVAPDVLRDMIRFLSESKTYAYPAPPKGYRPPMGVVFNLPNVKISALMSGERFTIPRENIIHGLRYVKKRQPDLYRGLMSIPSVKAARLTDDEVEEGWADKDEPAGLYKFSNADIIRDAAKLMVATGRYRLGRSRDGGPIRALGIEPALGSAILGHGSREIYSYSTVDMLAVLKNLKMIEPQVYQQVMRLDSVKSSRITDWHVENPGVAVRNESPPTHSRRRAEGEIAPSGDAPPPLLMATSIPPSMMVDPLKGNPLLQSAAGKISVARQQPPLRQRFQDFTNRIRERIDQGMFDQFAGIRYALGRTGASQDAYMAARLSTSHDSQMRAVLSYGHPVWRNGVMKVEGKGLLEILAPVSDPDMLRAWSVYMATTRAERLMNEGREHLFTAQEISEGRKLAQKYPILAAVAAEYAAFNKKVLDFAEQAGVIDPTTRPLWEHADYVPFYRVKDDRLAGPLHSNAGIGGQRSPIKTLKGGKEGIADIPANILLNTSALIDSAMKNYAAKTAIDALKGTGTVVKIPNVQFSQGLVPMNQVKQKLIQAGLNPNLIPQGALDGMQKMFIAEPPGGEGVISIMRDGKREFYRTDDMLLWQAMMMVNPKQFGSWMNIFRGPKRFLTTAITLDPGFMVRNFIRDLLSSFVISRDNYEPVHKAMAGFAQALAKTESMRNMMSAGAAFDSGYINAMDPEATARAMRKEMRSRGFKVSVLDTPAKLFNAYQSIGSAIENANRVAVYNAAKRAGKSDLQAAYEAKDLMDFSRHGSWPVIRFLMQSVPFMNARLQGLSRLKRGFVDNPISFTIKGLLVGMAGAALWLAFRDDERYKELEDWDKDTYFHFWIGDEHYRLPKPFEVGVIFNTIPERILEYWWSQEPDAGKLLLKRFGYALTETFSMNPIPQTVAPFVETYFNRNFFTQRQIVSPFEEERLPPEQFRPYTSPTMIELARALPDWMDDVSPKYRSPAYLENLYSGYMGTLGNYMLQAADEAVRASMDYPARPERQPADLPVIGSFYRGTSEDVRRVRYEEEFYNLVRKVTQVKGSLSFLEKTGIENRLELIDKKYEPYVAIAKEVQIARRDISRLNEAAMQVWMDPEMDPAAKRAELNDIQREKNDIYLETFKIRPGTRDNPITEEDLDYLLTQFGKSPDTLVRRLDRGRAPITADLVRDVLSIRGPIAQGAQ